MNVNYKNLLNKKIIRGFEKTAQRNIGARKYEYFDNNNSY